MKVLILNDSRGLMFNVTFNTFQGGDMRRFLFSVK